ncbi:MAG: hypothetical protein OEV78_03495 [Spirochaetia bacterium]|nr:hypothetical protein [Spirochaetia bacterium]
MPDMISSNIPVNAPPEVKVNKEAQENRIPSNIKVYDKKGQTLGKDDFLKLFVTQLSKQDPLNPVSDKEFIAQMAQFSALEQMNNVSSNMSELKSMQASNMVGKLITGKDALNGNMITGEITRVIYDNSGNIFLRTKNNTVQMKDVISIENVVPVKEVVAKEIIDDKKNNAVVSRETLPALKEIEDKKTAENSEKKPNPVVNGAAIFTKRAVTEYENNNKEILNH